MVYGFVKQSGGHVELASEPGRGTTVCLYLPAKDSGAEKMLRASAAESRASAASERILVVEDDPRVRRVTVRRLQELGYITVEADSGPAALKRLESEAPFDLLFTDVVMAGGMTGFDLAHEARRRHPQLKILFTSGFAEPAMARDLQSMKKSAWLGKPYDRNELKAKLREVLAR
jgi:CheY-like chemotaxis protein